MTKRVEVWDSERFEMKQSVRKYDRFEVTAIRFDDGFHDHRGVVLSLYVDAETGVVTTDVALYEKGLK